MMKYQDFGELCVALLQADMADISNIAVGRDVLRVLVERFGEAEEMEEEIDRLHVQLEETRHELKRELEGA